MADPSERLGFCALLGFPYGGASRTAEMSARRSFPCGGTSCTAEAPARGKFRAAGPLARANRSSRTAELPSLRTFPCGGAFRTAKVSARQSLPHARVFCTAELPARLCFPYGGTFCTAWLPTRRSFRTADFPVRWSSPPKSGKRVQNLNHKSVDVCMYVMCTYANAFTSMCISSTRNIRQYAHKPACTSRLRTRLRQVRACHAKARPARRAVRLRRRERRPDPAPL